MKNKFIFILFPLFNKYLLLSLVNKYLIFVFNLDIF